jgi:hypothetical protein
VSDGDASVVIDKRPLVLALLEGELKVRQVRDRVSLRERVVYFGPEDDNKGTRVILRSGPPPDPRGRK